MSKRDRSGYYLRGVGVTRGEVSAGLRKLAGAYRRAGAYTRASELTEMAGMVTATADLERAQAIAAEANQLVRSAWEYRRAALRGEVMRQPKLALVRN